jgi:hypothetical protein
MDVTRRQTTNIGAGKMPGRGPVNTFSHIREFPAADFKAVVRPNFDTLYSSAWLDLRDGPIIVSADADSDGRYYELPMYDMWTDAFAGPGPAHQRPGGGQLGGRPVRLERGPSRRPGPDRRADPGNLDHRPHADQWAGGFADLDPAVQEALGDVPAAALRAMQEAFPRIARVVNGWQMNTDTMGVYGNFYLKRAIVAMVGLGANSPEDAVYPVLMADADGAPVSGENHYVLHFDQDQLPPVRAFWSVTMYDAHGFQAANPLGRFAIGDRDPLRYNADGSLDLYLQHKSPGQDKEPNWLPAPPGPLGITMRLYSPKATVLNGLWNPPAVKKA